MILFSLIFFTNSIKLSARENNYIVSGTTAEYSGTGSISSEDIRAAGSYGSFKVIKINSNFTEILDKAFDGCSSLEKLFLSETVEFINGEAFVGCKSIKEFTVKPSNPFISTDSKALYTINKTKIIKVATSLTSYDILDGIEVVGSSSFSESKCVRVVIPKSVIFLEKGCFGGGTVQEVLFEEGSKLEAIKSDTFSWQTALNIHIPPSVREIEKSAFRSGYCKSIIFDDISESKLTKIGEFSLSGLNFVKLTLPEGITSFPPSCFSSCLFLEEINIPSKCSSIDGTSFSGCGRLSRVSIGWGNGWFRYNEDGALVDSAETTIYVLREDCTALFVPPTVTVIGSSALQGRRSLARVEVNASNGNYSSYKNVLYSKDFTRLLAIPGGVGESEIHPDATEIVSLAGAQTHIKRFDCGSSTKLMHIRSEAFMRCRIESFVFPASIEEIGASAFNAASIINITFVGESKIRSIGAASFRGSLLQVAQIADSVETIGDTAFGDCSDLRLVIISPNTRLNTIVSGFLRCTKLMNFTLYPSVKHIGRDSFKECANLVVDFSRCRAVTIGENAFRGCASIEAVRLPSTVERVEPYAFGGCRGLRELTFEGGINLSSLGSGCFESCALLESVVIPASVSSVDYSVFHGCASLSNLTVDVGNKELTAEGGIVYDRGGRRLLFCANGVAKAALMEGLSEISGNAFYKCGLLESVAFPRLCEVRVLESGTFLGCVKLGSIQIPASVETLEAGCFTDCGALESVEFGEGSRLSGIGESTFSGCKALTKVIFGNHSSLRSIAPKAFRGCIKLNEFTFMDSIERIGELAFSGTGIRKIKFGEESKIKYAEASFDNMTFLEEFIFNRNCKTISPRMFKGCVSLRKIIFPKNSIIEDIPDFAFINAINLEDITFSNMIISIGDNAFEGLTNLKHIEGIEYIKEIGARSFAQTSIESINLKNIEKLSTSSFENCIKLKEVNLSEPSKHFYLNAKTIRNINCVKEIPAKCFSGCVQLSTIDLTGIKTIGENSFENTSVEKIELSDSIENIFKEAFLNCYKLKEIVIKSKYISIGEKVFCNCIKLAEIKFCGSEAQSYNNAVDENKGRIRALVPVYFKGNKLCGLTVERRLDGECGLLKSVLGDPHYADVSKMFLVSPICNGEDYY